MVNDHRPAVKISVSLPESLKTQLDRYATDHELSVSETVQQALEAFLQPSEPPPGPVPGQDIAHLETMVSELRHDLQKVQSDLVRTQRALEQHRHYLAQLQPLVDMAGVAATLPPELFG